MLMKAKRTVDDAFGVEVTATTILSPEAAAYELRRGGGGDANDNPIAGQNYVYYFRVEAHTMRYRVTGDGLPRDLASNINTSIHPDGQPNVLQMKVRGDTIWVGVNDVALGTVTMPRPTGQPRTIGLIATMLGPSSQRDVQIRFRDFAIYALNS